MSDDEQNQDADSSITFAVVHKPNNDIQGVGKNVTDITIWGGTMTNVGECSASSLVMSRRDQLQRFIYLPERHKGGRMVRPNYFQGGRMVRPNYFRDDPYSIVEFPSLEVLGYFEDIGTPLQAKWKAPNLKTLCLFAGRACGTSMLDRWSIVPYTNDEEGPYQRRRGPRGLVLLAIVLQQCPKLDEILICATPDFDVPGKMEVVRKLTPPSPVPWSCLRLLEVALRKPQETKPDSTWDPVSSLGGNDPWLLVEKDTDDKDGCHLSRLPQNVMDLIVEFCHAPHWQQKEYV